MWWKGWGVDAAAMVMVAVTISYCFLNTNTNGGRNVDVVVAVVLVATITSCFPDNSRSVEAPPHLAMFVGVVSGFVFILTVLVVVARCKHHRQRRRPLPDGCPDNHKLTDGDKGK